MLFRSFLLFLPHLFIFVTGLTHFTELLILFIYFLVGSSYGILQLFSSTFVVSYFPSGSISQEHNHAHLRLIIMAVVKLKAWGLSKSRDANG
jgi:hypothetical protein